MGYIGTKPSAVPLTSADITDGIITNADIANSTINLTTKVTGALPVANGGTGLSALGSSLQVLRTNTGATALEYATLSTGATAGQVIQVVTATDSAQRTTASSSFVLASSTLSLSITPSSASNKVYILLAATCQSDNGRITIFRDSTNLGNATNGFGQVSGESSSIGAIAVLDSPNSTSAITYQVRIATFGGYFYLNAINNCLGTITAFEIKG